MLILNQNNIYNVESREKEQQLTSFKNIVFAHLNTRFRAAGIKINKAIEKFDVDKKG